MFPGVPERIDILSKEYVSCQCEKDSRRNIGAVPQMTFAEKAEGFNHRISRDTTGQTRPFSERKQIFVIWKAFTHFVMKNKLFVLCPQMTFAEKAEGFNHRISRDTTGQTRPFSERKQIFVIWKAFTHFVMKNKFHQAMLKPLLIFFQKIGILFLVH